MNFVPKAGPLVAEILSGSVILILGYFAIAYGEPAPLILHENPGIAVSLFALMAWLLGSFVDAVRNLLEELWDRRAPIRWDFFFHGQSDEIANLDHYFFSFYMADADLAIAILLYLILGRPLTSYVLGQRADFPWVVYIMLLIVALVFARDARSLRSEIKEYIDDSEKRRAEKSKAEVTS